MQFTVTGTLPFTVKCVGHEGEFVVAKHGFHPQLHRGLSYKDGKYDFFFYVETKDGLPRYTLSVWYLSSKRFAGLPPAIEAVDADRIEQNIRQYLENVSLVSFDEVEVPDRVPAIMFDWKIRQ